MKTSAAWWVDPGPRAPHGWTGSECVFAHYHEGGGLYCRRDRELVADQLAAAASEDGRTVGETRAVLLAPVGRRACHARVFAAILQVECPRLAQRRAQISGWLLLGKGYRSLVMGTGTPSGDASSQDEVIAVTLTRSSKAKMEFPVDLDTMIGVQSPFFWR